MLKRLITEGVGPAPRFDMELTDRLNVITGDNGLGKTFLLDTAWWACTRDWPESPALPSKLFAAAPGDWPDAKIETTVQGASKEAKSTFRYDARKAGWVRNKRARPTMPGLVLYARIDGGFSIYDPARHYFRALASKGIDDPDRPSAIHLTMAEVWRGKKDDADNTVCRGLLIDWREWQLGEPEIFRAFANVLAILSNGIEELVPSEKTLRLPGPSADLIPALRRGDQLIPITLASAAVKRIVALAYLIVWTWWAHQAAAEANGMTVEKRLFILVDEIGAHLHPYWQRRILPALVEAASALYGQDLKVQMLVSTHSPLVLASLEPTFDTTQDRLFHLRYADQQADLQVLPWSTRGSAEMWLTSEVFGLDEARSVEAEQAIAAAEALYDRRLTSSPPDDAGVKAVQAQLAAALPDHDAYWATWWRFIKSRSGGNGQP